MADGLLRMPTTNMIVFAGRLARDPELRYTQSGKAVCNFRLAHDLPRKTAAGDWTHETIFIDVETWGPVAEKVGERLRSGRPVIVEGFLSEEKWTDAQSGQPRRKHKIVAGKVRPLDRQDRSPGAAPGAESGNNQDQDDIPF